MNGTMLQSFEWNIQSKQHAGETWRCVIGGASQAVIDSDGTALFKSSKNPLMVWQPKRKLYVRFKGLLPMRKKK